MKYDKFKYLHDKLEKYYEDRNDLYSKVDDHVHCIWNLPPNITDVSWMRASITTDPADAVATTVRTFATHAPKFRITPMAANEPNRLKANAIEQILRWQWKKATQRAETRPLWDIVESAARYAMVAAQVVYLPCQFKTYETMGIDTRKAKAALALGPFALITHNPAGVYPLYSSMMLEGVMSVRTELADDFCSFWGDRAKDIKKKLKSSLVQYITCWDFTNYDERVVYAFLKTDQSTDSSGEQFEIINEPHKLPFLPWAVKKWGNTLDKESGYRVNPMLGSIIQADQWDTQNILESINTSLVIQRAAHPVAYDETPSGEGLDVTYNEAVSTVHGTTGMTKYTPLPPATVDPNVASNVDRWGARMSKATVARILQNFEFPAGTPYSSMMQVLDAAQGAVAAYKLLSQDSIAEIAKKMLEWAHFYKDNLTGKGSTKSTLGQEYALKSDEFNPEEIDIEVQLTPYIPIDQVALLNAGILGNKNLKMPLGRILEDVGIEDPEAAIEEWEQERQDETMVTLDIQKQTLELQAAIQMQQQQAQMAMQMQAEQAMQQQQAQAMANQPPSPEEAIPGQMLNPAQGGQPPVQVEAGVGRHVGRPRAGEGLK